MSNVEKNFLGMAISRAENLTHAIEIGVRPEHIRDPEVRAIYSQLLQLEATGQPATAQQLLRDLPASRDAIIEIVSGAPIAQNFEPWAREVKALHWQDMALLELHSLSSRIASRPTFDDVEKLSNELAEAVSRLSDSTQETTHGPKPVADVLRRMLQSLEDRISGNDQAITTGIPALDRAIGGGWRQGRLYVPAARPGIGKTSFLVNAMDHAATAGKKVCFFTVEMMDEQISQKHTSLRAQLPSPRLDRGDLTAEEIDRLHGGVAAIADLPIWIDDQSRGDIDYVVSSIRRQHRQGRLDIAFVDYLQLLNKRGRFQSRQAQLTEISMALKQLSVELRIPLVVLSTLNRQAEEAERPYIHHLKDTGSIEQDADVVMLLFRDSRQDTWLDIAKNRHGQTGLIGLVTNLAISQITGAEP